jgi:hypothetical protein
MSARPTAWTPAHSAFRVRASRLVGAVLAAIRQTRPSILAVSVPLSALALIAISTGCAGYRMGTRSLYRNDLRTVHVPMIESSSFRRNLGERLTEAVVKQIELTTPYKVVGDPATAESVLRCQLISDRKDLSIETRTDEPRDLRLTFVVQVDWVDRFGQPLIQRTEIPMPSAFFGISQSTGLIAEAGQSMATQQQSALEGLARQIVGQLEAAW